MNYPEFVASLFKSPEDTVRDLALCTGQEAQLLHATVGMVGEWLEYKQSTSRENMLEELADFWFFYNAGAQVLEVRTLSHKVFESGVQGYEAATYTVESLMCNALDIAKRAAIYRKAIDFYDIAERYGDIAAALQRVVAHHGVTIADLEAHNVAKLTKRYANGYSNEAAQARADKVE